MFRTPAMRFDLIKDEDDGEIHLRDWLLGIFFTLDTFIKIFNYVYINKTFAL